MYRSIFTYLNKAGFDKLIMNTGKNMQTVAVLPIIFLIPFICFQDLDASTEPDIYLSSDKILQGELILIRIKAKEGESVQIKWRGKEISMLESPDGSSWQGFISADLNDKPGKYKAVVDISPSGYKKQFEIEVINKEYGMRKLTLPREMVELDDKTLKRVNAESKVVGSLWDAPASTPVWRGYFMRPVDGDVAGPFGTGSIINDQPRSPHTGVDLVAEEGTPVRAINNGKVILTCDHFFTGNSIYIDHGGEVMSMYFHLKEIDVRQGDMVRKGQIIGLVGSTGRVTGPHLHWGIRINGARINPLSLIDVTKELEE